jgi:hypothetical protein
MPPVAIYCNELDIATVSTPSVSDFSKKNKKTNSNEQKLAVTSRAAVCAYVSLKAVSPRA